ncbi:MAG: FAD-dependent oxidoreductase [Deltaproteobacteria bacterium]|jgi:L-2-hydroxyglutarate oxidase LhgO|nr:FAD-dependent oxidoreductase [Deltaproteobacteria bacterium]
MTDKIPIAIIGGGALGLSVAYTLLQKGFKDIVLLEKNDGFGLEQSGSNSGVMHAGFLYPTGTDMAGFCVEGLRLLYRFCQDHNVPHAQTGKLMVAINSEQEKELQKYFHLATDNGLEGVEILTPDETQKREPCLRVSSAMYVPRSGVFDASFYVSTLYKKAAGMHDTPDMLMKNCRVTAIEAKKDGFTLDVEQSRGSDGHWQLECEMLINAAGLYAWDIAKMISPDLPYEKQYLKGEYFQFNRRDDLFIDANVYPVPILVVLPDGGKFLDLGAHLTPKVGPDERGNTQVAKEVLIGPIFTEVKDPEDYSSSINRSVFYESVKPFLPSLKEADLCRGHTGIIGLIKDQTDFMIMKDDSHPNCIHLLGMESPALTASLAIGRHVANLID